jgi:hypothetical protein
MLAATKTENTHLARLLGTRTRHHSFCSKLNARGICLNLSAAFISTKDTDRPIMKNHGLSQCYGAGLDPDPFRIKLGQWIRIGNEDPGRQNCRSKKEKKKKFYV